MQVLLEQIIDFDATIDHGCLRVVLIPCELLAETLDVLSLLLNALSIEVGSLELVKAGRFVRDYRQANAILYAYINLTIDWFIFQLTRFDQFDCFILTSKELVFVGGIESEVFKDLLLPMLFIPHLHKFFFVLFVNDVADYVLFSNLCHLSIWA